MDGFWNFLAVASDPATVVYLAHKYEPEIKAKLRDLKQVGLSGATFMDQNATSAQTLSTSAELTSMPKPPPSVAWSKIISAPLLGTYTLRSRSICFCAT